MTPLPASVPTRRRMGGFCVAAFALAGILCSCATATKVGKDGKTVTSGFGQRTTVTIYEDKTVVETTPLNWLDAVVGGVTRGALGWVTTQKEGVR